MTTSIPTRSVASPSVRAAAAAGVAAAAVLVINAAKRAQIVPTTEATQLLAPLAEVFAIALVTGMFAVCQSRLGKLGRAFFYLELAALALLVGVEFVINLVFAYLDPTIIADLRSGPLGLALTVASVLFLIGTIGFALTIAATKIVPRVPLAVYAIGSVPVALRSVVPEAALDIGLITMAIGVGWLSVWLFTRTDTTSQQRRSNS